MAFETVCGIAGLVSLGVQLVENCNKLKGFYNNVKYAPQDLEHFLEHLDMLDMLLKEIETAEATNPYLATTPVFTKCMRMCQAATETALLLLKRLEAAIKTKRRWGAIKMILKKDEIEKLDKRLDRVMKLLHISCTVNRIKPFRESIQLIQSSCLVVGEQASCSSLPQNTVCNADLSIIAPLLHQPMSEAQDESDVEEIIRDFEPAQYGCEIPARKRRTRIRLPLFFTDKIWEFEYQSSICGWDTRFKIRKIVPFYSGILAMASKLDLAGARALISSGQASVFDEDQHGDNVFWYCEPSSSSNSLLKDSDSVMRMYNFYNHTLSWLGTEQCIEWRHIALLYHSCPNFDPRIYRKLLSHVDFETRTETERNNILAEFYGPPEIIHEISLHLDTPLHVRTRETRLQLALQELYVGHQYNNHLTAVITAKVGCELTDGSLLDVIERDTTLLIRIVVMFGLALARGDPEAGTRLEAFLVSIVNCRSTYFNYEEGGTDLPLMEIFVQSYTKSSPIQMKWWDNEQCDKCFATIMHIWLNHLNKAELDLTEYGRGERSRVSRRSGLQLKLRPLKHRSHAEDLPWGCHDYCLPSVGDFHSCKLTSLQYGPQPEDWTAQFTYRLNPERIWEEFAGRFLEMLEHEDHPIPGGWQAEWDLEDITCKPVGEWSHPWCRRILPSKSWRRSVARYLAEEEALHEGFPTTPRWLLRRHQLRLRRGSMRKAVSCGFLEPGSFGPSVGGHCKYDEYTIRNYSPVKEIAGYHYRYS